MVETMAEAFECTFKQQEKLQVQTKRLIYSLYLVFPFLSQQSQRGSQQVVKGKIAVINTSIYPSLLYI